MQPATLHPGPLAGLEHDSVSQEAAKLATTGSEEFWFGSLSVGMRDASGQQYMRNRYYNPQTGQFTEPDPIGARGRADQLRVRGGRSGVV